MTIAPIIRGLRVMVPATIAATVLAVLAPGLALALPVPYWKLESTSAPTNLPLASDSDDQGVIAVNLADLGERAVDGESDPVSITDELPEGLEITSVVGDTSRAFGNNRGEQLLKGPGGFKCAASGSRSVNCTFGNRLEPYEELVIYIRVKVTTDTAGEPAGEVTVTGGGADSATLTQPLRINGEPTRFGVERYEQAMEAEEGNEDSEAGTHPYQMTTTFNLNQDLVPDQGSEAGETILRAEPVALPHSLRFELPPGFIGDPNATRPCTQVDFYSEHPNNTNHCPAESVVGTAAVTFNDPYYFQYSIFTVPVFSLVPSKGEPAQLGFEVAGVPVVLNTSLRTGGDYGVTVEAKDIPQAVGLLDSKVTIWGVPGAASHDISRGWGCLGFKEVPPCETSGQPEETEAQQEQNESQQEPFLTLPTECSQAPLSSVSGDSWPQEDGEVASFEAGGESPANTISRLPGALTACDTLPFAPTLSVHPELESASTTTGLTAQVHVPQQASLEAGKHKQAESAVKDTTVALPEGVLLSPSAANGLEACSEGEGGVGFTGFAELDHEGEPGVSTATFTEDLPSPLEPGVNFCPNGSKIGTVHIYSPDLPKHLADGSFKERPELEGGVYLAEQNANPFGSLFAMYIVAEEAESGVHVKLAGEVQVSANGQVISTFANTPDVPFEDLKLELFGGPRASVTTPALCGEYTTNAALTPWSGTAPVSSPSSFQITSGPGGSPCSNPQPLSPSFSTGTTNSQAAAYTPFELTLGHRDGDQAPTALSITTPPGLAAMLSHVTLCPEPQAAEGTCGAESLIGDVSATVGLGTEPFTETGGKAYITGPYDGAPFGLSVVVPTKAGPFDFGNVVTRSTITVNPTTAAVTIASVLPTMVSTAQHQNVGVPVQLKQIHVLINRPEFEFNPSSCAPMTIEGSLGGAQGASAPLSSPFQATNCASLPFTPSLRAFVSGQASKADGAALTVVVETPGLGQTNIRKVDLTLPEALPSRLSTIQQACLESVFNANPTSCDEGSVIGEGIAYTPVFKNPLRGSAYLVAHGGAEFPDVEFVLKGEGVTIVLDGKTLIKKGITYSRFETSPDAPLTKFESIFPTGPHSALTADTKLAATYNLCKLNLTMPTELTAQDGAFISTDTSIAKTGCAGVLANKKVKLTRKQLLAKALKACKKDKKRSKRLACEKAARKKYAAPAKHASKTAKHRA